MKQRVELALRELQQPSTQFSPQETTDPGPAATDPGPRPNPFGGETTSSTTARPSTSGGSLWKSELKTEKRIECIKALAAFGRAGKGKEAAEAILDVAAEYEFSPNPDGFGGDDSPESNLKDRIMEELTDYPKHLSERDWLPVLQERLTKEPEKYQGLTVQMLPRLFTSNASVKPILSALQKSDDQAVRQAALATIVMSQEVYSDDEKNELIKTVLAEEPVTAIRVLDQRLLDYASIEQAVEYLLSEDAQLQLAARQAVRLFFDKKKGPELAELLLTILNDKNREQDKLATVRALAALRFQANAAEPAFTAIIESTDDEELMLAAAFAREMVTLDRGIMRTSTTPESMTAIRVSNAGPSMNATNRNSWKHFRPKIPK